MTSKEREKAICEVAHIDDISDLSDGYHTFRQLYYQRMMLFAALVRQNRDRAWKSLRHSDGELCFGGGWFIVGIDTVEGSYTYHYEDTYFSLFDCIELERGKKWDGHTEKDVTRLLSLEQKSCSDAISRQAVINAIANTCFWLSSDNWKELMKCINSIPPINSQEPKYCDRNICLKNEYNGIGCDECEVTKSQKPQSESENEE